MRTTIVSLLLLCAVVAGPQPVAAQVTATQGKEPEGLTFNVFRSPMVLEFQLLP